MLRWDFNYVSILVLALGACAAEDPRSLVQVDLELGATILGSPAFTPKSPSGLVTQGFCYVLNVTAPDLMKSVNQDAGTCAHGYPGRGKVFGPFKYGDKAEVNVSAGEKRRIDLIGFSVSEDDVNCSKKLSFRQVAGEEKVFYGERALDPTGNTEPEDFIYIFQHSAALTLVPGPQKVAVQSVPWYQPPGETADYPRRYKCGSDDGSSLGELYISDSQIDFGSPQTSNLTLSIPLENVGYGDVSGLQVGIAGKGFENMPTPNSCQSVLSGESSCQLMINFNPAASGVINGLNQTTLIINYNDGENARTLSRPIIAQKAFVKLQAQESTDWGNTSLGSHPLKLLTLQNVGNVTITNLGLMDLGSTAFEYPHGFPGTDDPMKCDWGTQLAPGASCGVGIKFSPSTSGAYQTFLSTILAMTGGATSPVNQIDLRGKGVLP